MAHASAEKRRSDLTSPISPGSRHASLSVEVDDGDSHETEHGRMHDLQRDRFLINQGFKVLRFDNDQVLDGPDYVFTSKSRT
jgi:very-short-patch-repair endonuclease